MALILFVIRLFIKDTRVLRAAGFLTHSNTTHTHTHHID